MKRWKPFLLVLVALLSFNAAADVPEIEAESPSTSHEVEVGTTVTFEAFASLPELEGDLSVVNWYVSNGDSGPEEQDYDANGWGYDSEFSYTFDEEGEYTVEANAVDTDRTYSDQQAVWNVDVNDPIDGNRGDVRVHLQSVSPKETSGGDINVVLRTCGFPSAYYEEATVFDDDPFYNNNGNDELRTVSNALGSARCDAVEGDWHERQFSVSGSAIESAVSDEDDGNVELRVRVPGPQGSSFKSEQVKVDWIENQDPEPVNNADAAYYYIPEPPVEGEETQFNAQDSYDPDGEIVEYAWDFNNDGEYEQVTQDSVVTHTFDQAGSAEVTLRVKGPLRSDGEYDMSWEDKTIDINSKPEPDINIQQANPTPQTPGEKAEVEFDSGLSEDDGYIAERQWSIEENGDLKYSSSGMTYEKNLYPGDYTVRLELTDGEGAVNSVSKQFSVNEYQTQDSDGDGVPDYEDECPQEYGEKPNGCPEQQESPDADINLPGNVNTGENFDIDGTGSKDPDGSITEGELIINGNVVESSSNLQFQYSFDNPGSKNVELRVTDDDGLTDTVSRTVSVATESATGFPHNYDQNSDGKIGFSEVMNGMKAYSRGELSFERIRQLNVLWSSQQSIGEN